MLVKDENLMLFFNGFFYTDVDHSDEDDLMIILND